MKPAAFDYFKAENKDQILQLISEDSDETKILAGGQSLVPMMNFRLARPERLVDINEVPGLDYIKQENDRLLIGTRTRHIKFQNMGGSDPLSSLLRRSAHHIGHLPIRTRGTFGGSLAHCDSASEWCLVASLLDAEVIVESKARGERRIPIQDFFLSVFTTALEPDELLKEISLPTLDSDHLTGIAEFARRSGDFAIVAVTTDLTVQDQVITNARVSIGGVSEIPWRSAEAEQALIGIDLSDHKKSEQGIKAAAEVAANSVSPGSDAHGSAEYRKDLVRALLPKAILQGSSK